VPYPLAGSALTIDGRTPHSKGRSHSLNRNNYLAAIRLAACVQYWKVGRIDPKHGLPFGPPVALQAAGDKNMLWTIFVVLLVLWLLGLVTSYTFGGFVHILLVLALVVLVIQLFQGRRVV
jgi:uncharacterized membrane protein YtjA (UPF0391 family)